MLSFLSGWVWEYRDEYLRLPYTVANHWTLRSFDDGKLTVAAQALVLYLTTWNYQELPCNNLKRYYSSHTSANIEPSIRQDDTFDVGSVSTATLRCNCRNEAPDYASVWLLQLLAVIIRTVIIEINGKWVGAIVMVLGDIWRCIIAHRQCLPKHWYCAPRNTKIMPKTKVVGWFS